MLKTAALTLAVTLALAAPAQAGGYDRYPAPAPAAPQVHNYYGPVTVYTGTAPYRYDYGNAYPAYAPSSGYGASYGNAYAGAYAGAYANTYGQGYGSYGAEYGAPWGPPFAGGVGYSPYGSAAYGGYGSVYDARMDPWNGYNGGFGNGYW
jgi:hypothetical protein